MNSGNMTPEEIRKQFVDSFNLEKNGFSDMTLFDQGKIGFSVKKEPASWIKKRIGIKKGKIYISMIWAYIRQEDFLNDYLKKPILLRADMGLKNEEGIELNDSFIKREIFKPIEFSLKNQYYYNIEKNCFYKNDKSISAEEIIQEVYALHIKPTKLIWGIWLRTQIRFKNILLFIIAHFSNLLILILYSITLDKYAYSLLSEYVIFRGFTKKDRDRLMPNMYPPFDYGKNADDKTDKEHERVIKIFGYKASAWTIFVYCFLHLLIFTIAFLKDYKPMYLKLILSNNFLTINYAIFSLSIFENFIPKMLRYLIGSVSKLFSKISAIGLRV